MRYVIIFLLLVGMVFGEFVQDDIKPWDTNTYDIGTTSLRWKDGWFAGAMTVSGLTATGSFSNSGADTWTGSAANWSNSAKTITIFQNNNSALIFRVAAAQPYIHIDTVSGSENISFGNIETNPDYKFIGTGTLSVVGPLSVGGAGFTVDSLGNITAVGTVALGGKLTAGADEIEGSDFDINGGDISAVNVSGSLTWSAAQNFATGETIIALVDINSGTVDGITSLTVANDVDIGNFNLTANGLIVGDNEHIEIGVGGVLGGALGSDSRLYSDGTNTILEIESPTGTTSDNTNPQIHFTYFDVVGAGADLFIPAIRMNAQETSFGIAGLGVISHFLYVQDIVGTEDGNIVLADEDYPTTNDRFFLTYDSPNNRGRLYTDGANSPDILINPAGSLLLQPTGGTTIGDGTNEIQISATGDLSFAGSTGFYPRLIRQDAEPANGTGSTQIDNEETIMWIDTNDSNRVWFMYNDNTNTNVVKVELI